MKWNEKMVAEVAKVTEVAEGKAWRTNYIAPLIYISSGEAAKAPQPPLFRGEGDHEVVEGWSRSD
ncbi:MAG: hypothetical protein ACFWUL_05425 [Dialister sp.]